MTKQTMSEIASKTLGDSTSYAVFTDTFNPSLLNPMPRSLARESWGIEGERMGGFDRWTCHEATFLLDSGRPIAGTLVFVYGANSEFMIESKSMKLYLNTFDMCRMGPNLKEAIAAYESQIGIDLSQVLQTRVKVKFYDSNAYKLASKVDPLHGCQDLAALSGIEDIQFTDFQGLENHIETVEFDSVGDQQWYTNALRSRCRHTKQKDTGTATIRYRGTRRIRPVSILKQITSLREVNEFHEFCAEKILTEIDKKVNYMDCLGVALYYARRGSLDINPVRWIRGTDAAAWYSTIYDVNHIVEKTQGQ